jgi:membrane protease YdiL (CAAX protease family)
VFRPASQYITPIVNDLLLWCSVALLFSVTVAVATRPVFRRLLPPQRQRAVPWSGLEIIAVFLVYIILQALVSQLVLDSGLVGRLYGPDVVERLNAKDDPDAARAAQNRVGLLANVLMFPLLVAAILGFLRLVSGTRLHQLGLTWHRAGRNVLLGFLTWLIVTPPVLALNNLIYEIFSRLSGKGVSEHPLTKLAQERALPAELVLIVFAAVVVAPVLEELLFRGVTQRWAARHPWGGLATMAGALLFSLFFASERMGRALKSSEGPLEWPALLQAFAPSLFVLAMVPGFLWVCRKARTPFGPALYGTSLFFATMHSSVWPSPVPLFVLALALGWLAERTQSLVGPMVLHGLFNGVACVQLLWGP